jgi:molybdopterin synthase sulfur carrier subunit
MKITFKLFASLTDYLPVEARYTNVIELDIAPDATISQIIEPFGMLPSWCIWC